MSETMTRRQFLKRAALAAGGLALGLGSRARAQTGRPNFVFILTDDQRWDSMSNMPNRWPFLRTPNLDRLAAEGVRFDNAFVTISLCSPSRACFLTGRYAHSHGVCANDRMGLNPQIPTYPQLLQRAGYRTAFVGKWHMDPTSDPRPGFDYWLSFVGQGAYENPNLQENDRKFQAQGHMTDLLTDYANAWLQRQDGPFCLCLHHKAAHGPFTPLPRHKDAFAGAEIPEPPNWRDTLRGKPAWQRRERQYGAREDTTDRPVADEIPPTDWDPHNQGHLNYLRCILGLDESVGKVLQTLEQMGQLDNTVVMFASDNGFFLGEHRRGDKRTAHEEAIRIPMLMRYPALAQAGARIAPMALNIDVAPTFLDLAGVQAPPEMQGRSLRPILEGRPAGWRTSFLYEYFRENWLPGVPTMLAVRTERLKYVTYPDIEDLDELYDLQADPIEMRNLAQDPDHAADLAAMKAELERLKQHTQYQPPARGKATMLDVPAEPVLVMTFTRDAGDKVMDGSGKGNHGQAHGAAVVETQEAKARRFGGKDYIAVEKSPSLDPSRKAFTVSATVMAEGPDGVILARGGASHGYCLRLVAGRPELLLRADGQLVRLKAPEVLPQGWVTLTGVLTRDLNLLLLVNGIQAAKQSVDDPITTDPNEALEIGMDRGSKVSGEDNEGGFVGLMKEVRVWQGDSTALIADR